MSLLAFQIGVPLYFFVFAIAGHYQKRVIWSYRSTTKQTLYRYILLKWTQGRAISTEYNKKKHKNRWEFLKPLNIYKHLLWFIIILSNLHQQKNNFQTIKSITTLNFKSKISSEFKAVKRLSKPKIVINKSMEMKKKRSNAVFDFNYYWLMFQHLGRPFNRTHTPPSINSVLLEFSTSQI